MVTSWWCEVSDAGSIIRALPKSLGLLIWGPWITNLINHLFKYFTLYQSIRPTYTGVEVELHHCRGGETTNWTEVFCVHAGGPKGPRVTGYLALVRGDSTGRFYLQRHLDTQTSSVSNVECGPGVMLKCCNLLFLVLHSLSCTCTSVWDFLKMHKGVVLIMDIISMKKCCLWLN